MSSAIQLFLLVFTTVFLILKTRSARDSNFKDIFWALSAFIAMKASASPLVHKGLSALPVYASMFADSFVTMASVVSNIFLFHFGISLLTYKINTKINYKVFPVILFTAYMILYISGIVSQSDLESKSRLSFGYNGAILSFVGCVNYYYEKRKTLNSLKIKYGLLLLAIAFIFYALTEGILPSSSNIKKETMEIFRVLSTLLLTISSIAIKDILNEQKAKNIGFL